MDAEFEGYRRTHGSHKSGGKRPVEVLLGQDKRDTVFPNT